MPFGLTNAPATFQRALDIILLGLKRQIWLIYLDDVIIFSANAEQHVKDVDTVLHRLREAGVTLTLEKCIWFSDEVEYLGHIVRPGQLHVHNKNVDALKHAKCPTTKTQLKRFLGMCNVYVDTHYPTCPCYRGRSYPCRCLVADANTAAAIKEVLPVAWLKSTLPSMTRNFAYDPQLALRHFPRLNRVYGPYTYL